MFYFKKLLNIPIKEKKVVKGRGRRGKDALRPTVGALRSVARRDAP